MPKCNFKKDALIQITLLYFSICSGAVLTILFALYFAYKWRTQLNPKDRTKLLPRLSAVYVSFLCFERCGRVIQVYLKYNAEKKYFYLCNHLVNYLAMGVISFSGFLFISVKFVKSFENTPFEIDSKNRKILYGLVGLNIVSNYCVWILTGTPAITNTSTGLFAATLALLTAFILGVTLIIKVDLGFATRIRTLVAQNAFYHSNGKFISPSNSPKSEDTKQERFFTNDEVMNKGIPQRGSLADIKCASMTKYDFKQQILLKSAARSMVSAIWVSIGFFMLCFAGFLYATGSCQDYWTISGDICVALAFSIFSLSASFSLSHFHKEYQLCCSGCDGFLQRVVAWQTSQQMMEINQTQDEK